MSARSAMALIGAVPRRIFGYFLCEQKVTPVPPPPRRAELSQKELQRKDFDTHE